MEGNPSCDNRYSDSEEAREREIARGTCFRIVYLSKGIVSAVGGALLLTGGDICATLLTRSISPVAVTAMFSSISAAVSLIFTIASRVPFPCFRTALFALLPCSISLCACRLFLLGAINRLPVGDAISTFYTTPIFVAFLGWILLKQALKLSDVFFSLACIVGVVFVTRPPFVFRQISDDLPEIDIYGIVFAIGGALSNAIFLIGVRKCTDLGIHYIVIVSATHCTLFFFSVPLCTFMGDWKLPQPMYHSVFIPLYAICGLLAILCIFYAVAKERAVYVAVILTSEIVLVYVFQGIILNASPHWLTVTGAVFSILTLKQ